MIRVVEFSQQADSSPDGNSKDCILIAWPIDNEYVALCIQYHELFQASHSVARISSEIGCAFQRLVLFTNKLFTKAIPPLRNLSLTGTIVGGILVLGIGIHSSRV